ncbi:CCGSCS motif protein [Photobacterium sanguinicancri]|uniref:CCGSCS motif protein n=1 Tax=Photobacterium sanguinicancri TaxID=875932 RepID=A0ABX4G1Q7_9GAMM|nr:CCGSCS motif protein [Photobacterium sanguinicancri]MDO6496906.1 CCGSCS motif protein [Photobacterium sanguinicancri]OZS44926.1 CCGSCS motif protein [Photobacterium sanguinicancri]
MALSFKKLFKKDDSKANAVLTQQAKTEDTQTTIEEAENNTAEKKKGKHGEPGFCCGSCS